MKTLWNINKPLTATGILMMAVFVPSVIGIFLDPRIVTGMPAWLKPAKFAISTSIYAFTLAWIFRYLPAWGRLRAAIGWITSVVLVVEVGLIDIQAARGVTSHFNVGTPLDAVVFGIMGVAIAIAWFASIAVAVALFRQKFTDPVMGWALRLGVLITVFGAATGGLMVTPTRDQFAEAQATHHMTIAGSHTVGAADGGPGMTGTGWSREHGDLRVPHFIGLHAMQILPLVALLFRPKRAGTMIASGGVYALVFCLTLVQALGGRPFLGGVL
jgi:hypothetical protein